MRRPALDPRTGATVTIAWVIIANKPFYPFYVWWLVGDGVETSAITLVAIAFFLAVPLIARKSPFSARLALPLIGTIDTVCESIVFGRASATLLFLAPCMALTLVSFDPVEKWWQRGLTCFIFVCFAACWWRLKEPVFPWTGDQIATLSSINVFAVASLMAFIGVRYAGTSRENTSP
ncbi:MULTISPECIES: hypothetical protein [Rhizobium]|uniref:Multisubunit Na+/H+ antiporter MnhF subunit n=1 Tax=Rhizobium tropici TaxID=398 RepID=A0A6P1C3N1_RHITR|nr:MULTISPECIES: hypothetical protein [Rhizobium]AGB73172.1 hypothetical protein RTCIAT899_PA00375 [Rhizobium tropici CIAT 899]MBB4243680.1 multisubunit Na+/H+ antiporter MnhF subunit [Rhizobium tropici]MBB5595871.1 multisubunit Na+/H+ antiporter MnhF subunit [Rhizobium tropici]MBB6493863.1 multisubunit Na+/H+ antiporter MnhF subunit [Rhizobium tropici]NEV11307.1 hypothetical protein [Rhizobium tropici]